MEETGKTGSHLSSASAFVEGGIQHAFDDACSICLEDFCISDPSTVTSCKHEFHLQCILEWCQRSSQCPMCWQPIILIDPTSQELFDSVEHERSVRLNNTRFTTIFLHPACRGFELQHLAVGGNNADMEDHFFQHSATAASIGRAHHSLRRERVRSGSLERSRYLSSPNSNTPSGIPVLVSTPIGADSERVHATIATESLASTTTSVREYAGVTNVSPDHSTQIALLTSGTSTSSRQNISMTWTSGQSSPVNQDRPGPSDLQSLSESLKSRLNSVSMKYKESIFKSSRGWRERLFSRSNSVADIGSEVRREITAGIATVKSLMIERLDKRENRFSSPVASPSASAPMHLSTGPRNHDDIVDHANIHPNNILSNDAGFANHCNTHPDNAHISSWVVTSNPN